MDLINRILQIINQIATLVTIASIVLGAFNCFFGYRILKLTLGFWGFIWGALIAGGVALIVSLGDMNDKVVMSAFIGGLIGAVLMIISYFMGIFLMGATVGGLLGVILAIAGGKSPDPSTILILAVVGGIAFLVAQKLAVILTTAFGGSWALVSGMSKLAGGDWLNPLNMLLYPKESLQGFNILVLTWVLLGLVGIAFQYGKLPQLVLPQLPSEERAKQSDSCSAETQNGKRLQLSSNRRVALTQNRIIFAIIGIILFGGLVFTLTKREVKMESYIAFAVQWLIVPFILLGLLALSRVIVNSVSDFEFRISAMAGFWSGLVVFVLYVVSQLNVIHTPSFDLLRLPRLLIIELILGLVMGFCFLWLARVIIHTRFIGLGTLLLSAMSTIALFTYIFITNLRGSILCWTLGVALGALLHTVLFPSSIRNILKLQ